MDIVESPEPSVLWEVQAKMLSVLTKLVWDWKSLCEEWNLDCVMFLNSILYEVFWSHLNGCFLNSALNPLLHCLLITLYFCLPQNIIHFISRYVRNSGWLMIWCIILTPNTTFGSEINNEVICKEIRHPSLDFCCLLELS